MSEHESFAPPTAGRMVRYTLMNGPHMGDKRPALIVRVEPVPDWGEDGNPVCTLAVFGCEDDGVSFASAPVVRVRSTFDHRAEPAPGTWHY